LLVNPSDAVISSLYILHFHIANTRELSNFISILVRAFREQEVIFGD
jgi:hypothetical protein